MVNVCNLLCLGQKITSERTLSQCFVLVPTKLLHTTLNPRRIREDAA